MLAFKIESRAVPASAVRRGVDEKARAIESATGRKPGRAERKELKEEVLMELLPRAFPKETLVPVWIDPEARRVVIDSSSESRADEVVTSLVKDLQGFAVARISTATAPAAAMAEWLSSQEPPPEFTVDRECELKATDESKAVVRYGKHPLDIVEIRQHIAAGKRPTRLAMTWDDRVSFELTDGLVLRKIRFLEGVLDGTTNSGSSDDNFDADVAIATGELSAVLPSLLQALGGEVELDVDDQTA